VPPVVYTGELSLVEEDAEFLSPGEVTVIFSDERNDF
jgi:hypothetical protein